MTEEILEPELPIIDPHHHLWDRSRLDLRRMPFAEHGFSAMLRQRPRYLLDELLTDTAAGHDVRATVFVECRSMYRAHGPAAFRCVGETEFVNGIAAMSASGIYGPMQACAGIVGHADLRCGAAVGAVLDAHVGAGQGRFRGVRQSAAFDADPDVLGPLSARDIPAGLFADAGFRAGFAELAPRGLSFDAWLLEPQLAELVDLARAFPETTIVLDHVGGLGLRHVLHHIGSPLGWEELKHPRLVALTQSRDCAGRVRGGEIVQRYFERVDIFVLEVSLNFFPGLVSGFPCLLVGHVSGLRFSGAGIRREHVVWAITRALIRLAGKSNSTSWSSRGSCSRFANDRVFCVENILVVGVGAGD